MALFADQFLLGDLDDGNVAPGNLSIREAVRLANDDTKASEIRFSSLFNSKQTITLQTANGGQLSVTNPVTIVGSTVGVVLNGNGTNRLIDVTVAAPGAVMNFSNFRAIDVEGSFIRCEAGAELARVARLAMRHGLSGMEGLVGIPGTIGGAIYGNAGAHGSDIAASLRLAEILHDDGRVKRWEQSELAFGYRSSALKRARAAGQGGHVVLAAEFGLVRRDPAECLERMDVFSAYRRRTQPPGASLGSMFKNPPGDYAGRLIEAAGLKGLRVGGVVISPLHANFFVNTGDATAAQLAALIRLARREVLRQFGVLLTPEVRLIGPWPDDALSPERPD